MTDIGTAFGDERGNRRARRVQLAVLGLGLVGLGGMFASFWWPAPAPPSPPGVPEITLPDLGGSPAEESWISLGEQRLAANEARIGALEKRLGEADGRNAELAAANETLRRRLDEQERDAKAVIDAQAAAIRGAAEAADDPFAGLPQIPSPVPSPGAAGGPATVPPASRGASSGQDDPFMASGAAASGPVIADPLAAPATSLVRFELAPRPGDGAREDRGHDERGHDEDVKDTAFYLPSGAHAPAVITTGAAASVSVTGQADPRPVLMRITGRASTAADGRGDVLEADIRGCTIIGEARGDLSSERVYVRLQTMTCRRGRGVVETAVRGFVAGTGQAGVRGTVITREGDLVEKSAWAGVLSGFGQSASQGLRPPALVTDSGNRPSDAEVLANAGKAGLAQGVGNAGERLSQYYIQRAEQYQPVVSLKGGTVVEVVFISGTWLDGRGPEGGPDTRQDRGHDGLVPVSALRGDG